MKRCVRIVPAALAPRRGRARRRLPRGHDDGVIVASGHVEATEVLVSTKVPGAARAPRRSTRAPW